MTFGLECFSQGDLQEAVSVIDRYCDLTKIELYEGIMDEIERVLLNEKELPDTRTTLLAFFEMLRSWKLETTDHLIRNIMKPITFKDCLKHQLDKISA